MKSFSILLPAFIMAAAPSVSASEPIRLNCTWVRSVDGKTGQPQPLSGSSFFTYTPIAEDSGLLKKEGLGAEFAAAILDDGTIVGTVLYELGELMMEQHVQINRYTGKITNVISAVKDKRSPLIFEGQCTKVTAPLF